MAQWAEIVEIVAPAEAVTGSRVDITVRIRNRYTATLGILAYGAFLLGNTWIIITFPSNWANVGSGQTHSFDGYFTMPNSSITIHAYSYFFDEEWRFDDEKTKDIGLAELAPGFSEFKITDYAKV